VLRLEDNCNGCADEDRKGDEYSLDPNRSDEFEEKFGDEALVDSVATLVEMLGFLSPAVPSQEVEQWVALYSHCCPNEYFFSGVSGGEQVSRAYSLTVDEASLVSIEGDVPVYPRRFRVLHRDASGECVENGDIGIFIHCEDDTVAAGGAARSALTCKTLLAAASYSGGDLEWAYVVPGSEDLVAAVLVALNDPSGRTRDKYLRGFN
jgi:hypothetical protein